MWPPAATSSLDMYTDPAEPPPAEPPPAEPPPADPVPDPAEPDSGAEGYTS
jgi:vacuolar protein sorting-associated protein 29